MVLRAGNYTGWEEEDIMRWERKPRLRRKEKEHKCTYRHTTTSCSGGDVASGGTNGYREHSFLLVIRPDSGRRGQLWALGYFLGWVKASEDCLQCSYLAPMQECTVRT